LFAAVIIHQEVGELVRLERWSTEKVHTTQAASDCLWWALAAPWEEEEEAVEA